MINVCLVAPVPPPIGGIAFWTTNIINYEQSDVKFTLIDISPKYRFSKKQNKIKKLICNFLSLCKTKAKLKQVLKNQDITCVHITTSGALSFVRDIVLLKICKKYGVKSIVHFHFGRTKDILGGNGIEKKLLLKVINNASKILTMDKITFDKLNNYEICSSKIKYMPNPISYSSNYILQSEKKSNVIFVGWVIKTKGIEELIESWNSIGNIYQNWSLKIIGAVDDNYKKELQLLNCTNNIEFVGELNHDDCFKQIKESSILVLPSYFEGFPNVILEAMIASTAIIATNVGEIPQLLSDECGILINHHCVKDITKALENLISDSKKREQLSLNAFNKVKANYTIDKVFNALVNEWKM